MAWTTELKGNPMFEPSQLITCETISDFSFFFFLNTNMTKAKYVYVD